MRYDHTGGSESVYSTCRSGVTSNTIVSGQALRLRSGLGEGGREEGGAGREASGMG